MNCWRFDARIFDACRDVPRSARGEFELPEAVALATRRGARFKAIPARGPVLDLAPRRHRRHRAAAGGTWRRGHDGDGDSRRPSSSGASIPRRTTRRRRSSRSSSGRCCATLTGGPARHAWWVPGRLEVFGKHTDYAGGRTLVCAVPRGLAVAREPARRRPRPRHGRDARPRRRAAAARRRRRSPAGATMPRSRRGGSRRTSRARALGADIVLCQRSAARIGHEQLQRPGRRHRRRRSSVSRASTIARSGAPTSAARSTSRATSPASRTA